MGSTLRSGVTLRLGLISLPVDVLSAVSSEKAVSFNMLCTGDGTEHPPARVSQTYNCPTCKKADKADAFKKGTQKEDGTYVIATDEDIAALTVDESIQKTLDFTAHKVDEVEASTLPSGKVYYLRPGKGAGENYPLMVNLLRKRDDLALCTIFAVRGAPAMYRLEAMGDVLTVRELAWPDSMNETPKVTLDFNPALLTAAEAFTESLLAPFDPTTFTDSRKETLEEFLSRDGIEGETEEKKEKTAPSGPSLLDQLNAAVKAPKRKKTA